MATTQPDETISIPQDFDAEQAVLGSILLEREAAPRVFAILRPDDFYRTYHRQIAECMLACYERREPMDLVTVSAEVRRRGWLEEIGGGEYLTALIGEVPTAAHVVRYANIVAEKAVLRSMMQIASGANKAARDNPEDVGALLAEVGERFTALYRNRVGGSVFASVAGEFENDINRLWADINSTRGAVSSARFGVGEVDRLTAGLETERYVVIKADTKHGKSQLLRQSVLETTRRFRDDESGRVAVVFVLEEGLLAWKRKAWAWMAQLDSRLLTVPGRGKRYFEEHPADEGRLNDALCEWPTLDPYLKLTSRVRDVRQIEATCRALAMEHNIGLIAIDYFQCLSGGEGRTEEQEYSDRAQRLQTLADELECPVVVPSQVTLDQRTGKYNTKGARAIEHNASKVLLWVRDAEEGVLIDGGNLVCQLDRNGPGFRPLRLETDKTCGRFWDVQEYSLMKSYSGGNPYDD